jgi:hypothetical protein
MRGQWGSMRHVVVLVFLLLVIAPAPMASGQDDSVALTPGTWLGTMGAGGVLTGTVDGVTATWTGWVDGSFTFGVAGGSASGDWDWSGDAEVSASTPAGELELTMQSLASGPLAGSASRLTLTGQQSTTGQGTFMGITTDVGPVPNPVDPIDVVFTDASCNVAFGDWTTSLEELAGESGLDGSLTGYFVANNLAPTADEALAADLAARFEDHYDRALDASSRIIGDFSTGLLLDTIALIEEGLALEAEVDRLGGECAFDQVDGGPFATTLTSLLASMLQVAIPQLDAYELMNATQVLLATGAIGDGASPVITDLIEPLFADRAQALLDRSIVADSGIHADGRPCSAVEPCVILDEGILQLFVTADLIGVQLTAAGVPITYPTLIAAQR